MRPRATIEERATLSWLGVEAMRSGLDELAELAWDLEQTMALRYVELVAGVPIEHWDTDLHASDWMPEEVGGLEWQLEQLVLQLQDLGALDLAQQLVDELDRRFAGGVDDRRLAEFVAGAWAYLELLDCVDVADILAGLAAAMLVDANELDSADEPTSWTSEHERELGPAPPCRLHTSVSRHGPPSDGVMVVRVREVATAPT